MSSSTNIHAKRQEPSRLLSLRLALLANGYEPIPVTGKAPAARAWQMGEMTRERIASDCTEHPKAPSTGLRTGRVVGVDIDVEDPAEAEAFKRAVETALGPTPFVRVGRKGMILCYGNAEPIGKITVASADGTKVELLGRGQQFVAYGVHPDTGEPYRWVGEAGPAKAEAWELPAVTGQQLRELPAALAELMAAHPGVKVSGDTGERPGADVVELRPRRDLPPLPAQEIRDRLLAYDPDCGRDEWRDLAAALHATPCADPEFDKRALFVEWSRRGRAKFLSDDDCERVYDSMPPKEGGLRSGTFIWLTNAAGYTGPTLARDTRSAAEVFGPAIEALDTNDALPSPSDWEARVASFRGLEPDEDAGLPELEFWDREGTLPKSPDGCVGVAYGASGAHKTNIVLSVLMDAMIERDARVLFLAGEGGHGVGKGRIPALCAAHGITPKDLRGKWRLVKKVPVLQSADDIRALIEAQRDFRPNIVVVDTLATALPGADENAASTGSLLTGNGPAGTLRRAWRAAVLFVAHTGKDKTKGLRGTSAFVANSDFAWEITGDKEAGVAKRFIRKMKDGPDGFSVFHRIDTGLKGVPVVRRIQDAEYHAALKAGTSQDRCEVEAALKELDSAGDREITTPVLASHLVRSEKDETPERTEQRRHNEMKRLQSLILQKGVPGPLARYVEHDHRGAPLKPYHWRLPPRGDDTAMDMDDED